MCFHVCTFALQVLSFLFPKQRQSNANSCQVAGTKSRFGTVTAAAAGRSTAPGDGAWGTAAPLGGLSDPEEPAALHAVQDVHGISLQGST